MKIRAKMKPFFKAAVKDDGVLEMMIYEDIGADWFGDGLTAKTIKQKIDGAGAFSSIQLRINSPGGDAFEGVAIGNLLKSTGKPIDVCVDGIAASAASIIAMCGTTITMAANSMMMIHNAWTGCVGNASDMRKMADVLDKIDEGAIAQTYVSRTGKPMDEIKALMADETWMTAQECVDGGFATAIVSEADDASAMAMARKFQSLTRMKKLPENLKNDTAECECECSACVDGDCENCTMEGCEDPNCTDCPMQGGADNSVVPPAAESNLSLYEARLAMLRVA